MSFSALQRAEIAEIEIRKRITNPMQLVSVLFNEPKLLKLWCTHGQRYPVVGFSALQRAEIAEIICDIAARALPVSFSALQRAEIAEILRRLRRGGPY